MAYRAPFALRGAALRFCVGSSFVTVAVSLGRGEDVAAFVRALCSQQACPRALLPALFCALRLLFEEAAPRADLEQAAGAVARWRGEGRRAAGEEEGLERALRVLEGTPWGAELRQLEEDQRAAREVRAGAASRASGSPAVSGRKCTGTATRRRGFWRTRSRW